MSNNTTLPGTGDVVRDIDKGGVKTQVFTLDVGGSGAETLVAGTVPVSGTVALSGTVPISASALPLPTGAAVDSSLTTLNTTVGTGNTSLGTLNTNVGAQADVAATADTGSFSLIAYLKRGIAKLTSIVTALAGGLPAALGTGGGLKVDGSGTALPISGTVGVSGSVGVTGTFFQATQPVSGTVGISGTVPTSASPVTSGGLSAYRNISILATGVSIKGSAGQIYGYYLYNNSAATRFVKFYNKATAPTIGTDTPVLTIPLPAGGGANLSFPIGVAFALGIGIGATQLVADSDTTAPSANDVIVDVYYS